MDEMPIISFCIFQIPLLSLSRKSTLKKIKNLELLSKKWSGFFLTCELIVLSEFVETKATTVSTYRYIETVFPQWYTSFNIHEDW